MGQYYKFVNLDTKEWLYPHDYGDGSKLMEHSYIDNSLVLAAMQMLLDKPSKVIWAGDYGEKTFSDFSGNPVEQLIDTLDKPENIYSELKPQDKVKPTPLKKGKYFVINHTTKEYIDLSKIKKDYSGYKIHPLPILISDGNGNGGGDYSGTNEDLAGIWAGHIISISKTKPKEFNEVSFEFKED